LRLSSHSSDDDEEAAPRAPRAAVVREPEPINDFERARLENIRRNQEALAGTSLPGCLFCSLLLTRHRSRPPAALMGGVQAIAPKMSQAAAPGGPRRRRPAVRPLCTRCAAAAAAHPPPASAQASESEEVVQLRERKAEAAEAALAARAHVDTADAAITAAEAAFARGAGTEAVMDVRARGRVAQAVGAP
jgi:hypothetical protein